MSEQLIIVLIPGGGVRSEQAVASRMDTVGRSRSE